MPPLRTPGPGSYLSEASYRSVEEESPAASLASRIPLVAATKGGDSPGPKYLLPLPADHAGHLLPQRERFDRDRGGVGPGQYGGLGAAALGVLRAAPQPSLAGRDGLSEMDRLLKQSASSPGPVYRVREPGGAEYQRFSKAERPSPFGTGAAAATAGPGSHDLAGALHATRPDGAPDGG